MCGHLLECNRHRLVLTEAVPLPKPVEHARADVATERGLDDLVLRPARPRSFGPDGIEHLVVKLDSRGIPRHLASLPAWQDECGR
jgi:hypothetical protein